MSSKRPQSAGGPSRGQRRRPQPPTIELTATEIARNPVPEERQPEAGPTGAPEAVTPPEPVSEPAPQAEQPPTEPTAAAPEPAAAMAPATAEAPEAKAEEAVAADPASQAAPEVATAQESDTERATAAGEPPPQPAKPEAEATYAAEAPWEDMPPSAEAAAPPPPEPPPPDPAPRGERPMRTPAWALLAAGIAGGLIVIGVLGGLYAADLIPGRSGGDDALAARLATLEGRIRDLAARPGAPNAAPAVAPKTIDELTARVGKIEAEMSAPRPPGSDPKLAGRIDAAEASAKALGDTVGGLTRRLDDNAAALREARSRADAAAATARELQAALRNAPPASQADVEAEGQRIAALEGTVKTLEAEFAQRKANAGTDRTGRAALAAAVLRNAVEGGQPFAVELGAAKTLTDDSTLLASLEPFANSGVPTKAELTAELFAVLPALRRVEQVAPAQGGFLDRLQANAEKLVRIRRIDENAASAEPADAIARIELDATRGNIDAALAELDKLAPEARAPADAWIRRAKARQTAIAAAQRFAAQALAALGQPAQ